MGQAIGQVLALAVVVTLSPVPIIAVVLMLVTPCAAVNGPAFVVGLAIVGAVVLGIARPADATSDGGPATWVNVLKLISDARLEHAIEARRLQRRGARRAAVGR